MFVEYVAHNRNINSLAVAIALSKKGIIMQQTLSRYLNKLNHFLDVTGVSELFGLTQETIYRYCREDVLPHLKIGKNLRFDPRALSSWIQEHHSVVESSVPERITSWVREHVLDRTLCLPIPVPIINTIAGLAPSWRTDARAALNESDTTQLVSLLKVFQAELEANLSLEEQRDLLAELFRLEAYYA